MKKVRMLRSLGGEDWKLGKGQEIELDDRQALAWESVRVCEILSDSYAKELKPFQVPNRREFYETAEKQEYEKAIQIEHIPAKVPKEIRKAPEKTVEVKKEIKKAVKKPVKKR